MMSELTYDDYNFLLEALDAKQSSLMMSGVAMGLVGAMLSDDSDEAKERLHSSVDDAEVESKAIEERVIMLKAKLITIRDQLMIKNLETGGDHHE